MAKIALIGYGKMGKTIEQISKDRNNTITKIYDVDNSDDVTSISRDVCDVAIEFTTPESAVKNLTACIKNNVPVVSGTTGWLDQWGEVTGLCKQHDGAFFYASNFSIGVNIFFQLNKYLAGVMKNFEEYDVSMEETHHIHKKDAPSGTAITLAEGVMDQVSRKKEWKLDRAQKPEELVIKAYRENEVPGTHIIKYMSEIDDISIKHQAHSRKGFATGAVVAAEWIVGRTGVFGMEDMLKLGE